MLRGFWTVLATGFTLAVIGLSMAMNFAFGYGLGTSELNSRILGALSVACDGLKALLPLSIAWQWAEGRRLAAGAGALLFALLLGYGGASAIGFAAENAASLTGGRESRNNDLLVLSADLAAAEVDRAALPAHRLSGVIKADLAVLKQDRVWDATSGCTQATLPASRAFCQRLAALEGELAVAAEDIRLSAKIDQLTHGAARARAAGAGREADPQARAIAHLTGVESSRVRSVLTWLLAFAVEAISAFGLFAIRRRERPRESPAARFHGAAIPSSSRALRLATGTEEQRQVEPPPAWRLAKAG